MNMGLGFAKTVNSGGKADSKAPDSERTSGFYDWVTTHVKGVWARIASPYHVRGLSTAVEA